MPEWVIALLGVAVGFALNEASSIAKAKIKARKYLLAMKDELNTNLHQLSQKEDIAQQMISALKSGKLLPGASVPFASTVYERHFPDLVGSLKPIERDNIRHIYSNLKVLDNTLDEFERSIKKDIHSACINDVEAAYIGRLNDVLENYRILKNLIKKYLEEAPVDIYYRHGHST